MSTRATSHQPPGTFPLTRPRRLRTQPWLREMVQEVRLSPADLIWPLFVQEGENKRTPIPTLPGCARLSIDLLVEVAREAHQAGIPAVALFPVIDASLKTPHGDEALNPDNLICRAIGAIKESVPGIGIIADVALDPYTSHGQDGLLENGIILNDATVEVLREQALTMARAGCDIVAPSDMMDGRIGAIRGALEKAGHHDTVILSYCVKYASHLYGPFRDAVDSKAFLGSADKRTYQMDFARVDDALREAQLDIAEGADMLMVKPALPYLDIVQRLSSAFPVPVLAYQVSGEYAMLHAAASAGALQLDAAMLECLTGIKRAGARAILTYGALDVAQSLVD